MIPVTPASEPNDFAGKVRNPGQRFLSSTPRPRSSDWGGHDYWRRATDDLLRAYGNICAYSGSWTFRNGGSPRPGLEDSSIDHFLPKSKYPDKAYEWSNYRLARTRLNNLKGNHEDVLDPFLLQERWFVLDFTTFLVQPNTNLANNDMHKVDATIVRLGLNAEQDYVQERIAVVAQYCHGRLKKFQLESKWPFIASEMTAQNFDVSIRPNLLRVFSSLSVGP